MKAEVAAVAAVAPKPLPVPASESIFRHRSITKLFNENFLFWCSRWQHEHGGSLERAYQRSQQYQLVGACMSCMRVMYVMYVKYAWGASFLHSMNYKICFPISVQGFVWIPWQQNSHLSGFGNFFSRAFSFFFFFSLVSSSSYLVTLKTAHSLLALILG